MCRISNCCSCCCSCCCRHPVMAKWPVGHKWFFMKLELIQVWLQDWIGGTSLIPLEDYFKATPYWEYPYPCITLAYKYRWFQPSTPQMSLYTRGENPQSSNMQRKFKKLLFSYCYFNQRISLTPTFSILPHNWACHSRSINQFPVFGVWMYLVNKLDKFDGHRHHRWHRNSMSLHVFFLNKLFYGFALKRVLFEK